MRRLLLASVAAALATGGSIASDAVSVSGAEGSARLDYVGDDWRIGVGLSDEGDLVTELLGVLAYGERDAWVAEGWFQDGAGGLKLNYHWLPGDGNPAEQEELPGVYKLYIAADQNRDDDRKLSIGGGYEKEDVFFSTQFSFGLTDERLVSGFTDVFQVFVLGNDASGRPFRQLQTTSVLTETFEQAYDYGVGFRLGRYLNNPNLRIQGGVDYEWGDFDSSQTTFSATAEKFFVGTGHSLALSVEHFEKDGDFEIDDSDTRGMLIWRYAFGQTYRSRIAAADLVAPVAAAETMASAPAQPLTETRVIRSEVEMESDAFFAFDSADLLPESEQRLQQLAQRIVSGRILGRISVVGHTCDRGPEAYNQTLSVRRAESVRDALVAYGVDPAAIVTDGRGEAEPSVPNSSEENRRLNRRVDVNFIRVEEREEVVQVAPQPQIEAVSVQEETVRETPAWVLRALRNPAQHKRAVDVYRFERSTTTVALGEREFLNRAPLAENDQATAARNSTELFIDVLANDSDPDGDPLTVVSVTQPASGSVVNSGDFVTYAPAAGFQGEDTFSYTVSDGSDSAAATVTVTVSNDTPVAVPDSAETRAGEAVLIDVLANDSDPNGDTLSLVAVSAAGNGTVSIDGDAVRYTPNQGFSGADTFRYTVRDAAGAEASAEVTVTVTNDAPIAVADSAETRVGVAVTVDVLANDSDPNGDALELVAVSAAGNGTASIQGTAVRYQPADGFTGSDAFSYTVQDAGGAEATAQVTVTVSGQPPVAAPDQAEVSIGQSVDIDVLANDSDPDGDPIALIGVGQAQRGTVAIVGDRLRYTPDTSGAGSDSFSYEIEAGGERATGMVMVDIVAAAPTAADDSATTDQDQPVVIDVLANDQPGFGQPLTIIEVQDAANGSVRIEGDAIVYTPAAGFVGTDAFGYTIREQNGATANATVTVTVRSANRAPIARDDLVLTRDPTLTQVANVLLNDSDPDGDPLTIVELQNLPGAEIGSFSITDDNQIRFVPNNWSGASIQIRYRISDGRGGFAEAMVEIKC